MPVVCFHCKYPRLREKAPSSFPRYKRPIFSKSRLPTVHFLWHRCHLYFLVSAHDLWSRCRFYGLYNSQKPGRSVSASVAIMTRYPAGTLVRFTTVNDRCDVHAKGQGQKWKVKVTEVMTPFSRFRTVTPVWIHIWQWNDAQNLMLLRRGSPLFFKVIRQIARSHG